MSLFNSSFHDPLPSTTTTTQMPAILMTMSNLHHDSSSSSLPSSSDVPFPMIHAAVPLLVLLILMTGLTIGFLCLVYMYFKRKKRFNAYVYRRLPMIWWWVFLSHFTPPFIYISTQKSSDCDLNTLPTIRTIECHHCFLHLDSSWWLLRVSFAIYFHRPMPFNVIVTSLRNLDKRSVSSYCVSLLVLTKNKHHVL